MIERAKVNIISLFPKDLGGFVSWKPNFVSLCKTIYPNGTDDMAEGRKGRKRF